MRRKTRPAGTSAGDFVQKVTNPAYTREIGDSGRTQHSDHAMSACGDRKNLARVALPVLSAEPQAAESAADDAAVPAVVRTKQWRSIQELAQTKEFREMLHREFPKGATEWDDSSDDDDSESGASRRSFLKVMAASLALAGVGGISGCVKRPRELILPYVRPPEELVYGRPLYFATAYSFGGCARGILVESHEGRPTKIEGNPDHPASLGATDVFGQAHVLGLYDPDRSQNVLRDGIISDWDTFANQITANLASRKGNGGRGVRLLTENVTSPTLATQITEFLKQYPQARWHQWTPVNDDNAMDGAQQALGRPVRPIYRFDQAQVILSLDDNFLFEHGGSLRYARQFIDGRRVRHDRREMNRLHVAESAPTITGAMADHRVRVPAGRIESIARAIAAGVGVAGVDANADAKTQAFVAAVVKDLQAANGRSIVTAGAAQPPVVHALAHAINAQLGNVGKTVTYIDPIDAQPTPKLDSLRQLVADMDAGSVDVLIIIGANPAYTAPADFDFARKLEAFSRTPGKQSVHLSLYNDETSFYCHWHLTMAHELEAWGDLRSDDGTASIVQPLISPLYQGHSAIELLAVLAGNRDKTGYELVRDYWRGQRAGQDFDKQWAYWLQLGVIPDTASKPVDVRPSGLSFRSGAATQATVNGFEVIFRPDPHIWDGRYANNGWLQELPKPLTRMTWDNYAAISPRTWEKLGLDDPNDYASKAVTPLIDIGLAGRTLRVAAWPVPGHPDDCATVYLGYGRTRAGRVGSDLGFNAYTIRTSDGLWAASGARIESANDDYVLACVQNHQSMDQHERDLLKVAPVSEYEKLHAEKDGIAKPGRVSVQPAESLLPAHEYPYNKWGMIIDQNACIGCNACVIACQSENNIPVVGKEQVRKGREMHWIRLDTYYEGNPEEAQGPYFQPLPCMHCENAPCELVCPVGATIHDAEGTNNMVYNRCVGTRYCSNNCPYKVRHFNFLQFSNQTDESIKLMYNPEVTVRTRGVMEKCTYCIQRINGARIDAKREFVEGKRATDLVRDGEVMTACQQVCPTQAITFGNMNDAGGTLVKLHNEPTTYGLLDELQTQPRTQYLPRFTNPASGKGEA